MPTKTLQKPVEQEKPAVVADTRIELLRSAVAKMHKGAYKIDVKPLWEGRWRVNVYTAKNDGIMTLVSMPYSYFVRFEDGFNYDPKLGTKASMDLSFLD